MSKKDKLVKRLLSRPKDFTFEELETLLGFFGYTRSNKGKTSGSRVEFACHDRKPVTLDRPHRVKELLRYQIKQVIDVLREEGLL